MMISSSNHISASDIIAFFFIIESNSKNSNNKRANNGIKHFSNEEVKMINKYMKKIFNIHCHQGNAIKTTLRSHLIPVRMAMINKTKPRNC
jgi:hypothetical protein